MNFQRLVCNGLLVGLLSLTPAAWSVPILGISATSSTGTIGDGGADINDTVNGNGLNGGQTLLSTHNDSIAANSWSFTNPTVVGTITYTLNGLFTVNGFSFWNNNAVGGTFGIQGVSIESSTDNVVYNPIFGSPAVFAQTGGLGPLAPEQFVFAGVNASFIRFNVASNYGATRSGYNEVLFDGIAVAPGAPEMDARSATAPLVLCLGMLLLLFERKKQAVA